MSRRVLWIVAALSSLSCGEVGPVEFRGIGGYNPEYAGTVTILDLGDSRVVFDATFVGPCRVTSWEVEVGRGGEIATVTPFYLAEPTGERCASLHRVTEAFDFVGFDVARFQVFGGADPAHPVGVLDTTVAFQ